ncbi:MAG: FAD-binding protein [Planctomycetaceae bacterium]|nr:FAD-binding protein [Planctomycetaceae bacterium]
MYSTDGSLYQVPPTGVVWPRDRDDVVAVARFAAENNLPLHPRGAGSGIAGSALGGGLVIDFSRYMRRILEIGESTVRVEPGLVHSALNAVLREHGRYFPPDPSNTRVTTIGGMLGVDAAGSHSVRVGSTRDHVLDIELVLAGGEVLQLGSEPLHQLRGLPPTAAVPRPFVDLNLSGVASSADSTRTESLRRTLVSKLGRLLSDSAGLIEKHQPPLIRNSAGYYLRGGLADGAVHFPRLLTGSEGTLGLFTAATLHTAPLPANRAVVVLLFGQLEAAVQTVQAIAGERPTACDLLDRRLLTLAREADPRFEEMISPAAEAALLVETTGFSDREARMRLRKLIDAVRNVNLRTVIAAETSDEAEIEFLWSLPARVVSLLTGLQGTIRPVPFVEDLAVPPEAMYEFFAGAQKVFQKHQVTASLYAHALAGQVHLRPFLPPPDSHSGERMEGIARDLYRLVFAIGGTVSGEHGDGLSRSSFLREQYGDLYPVFQQVKELFDPRNLMNPGRILTDDPHLMRRNLRTVQPAEPPAIVNLQLKWNTEQFTEAASRCNGCGMCRSQSAEERMCPFFRIDATEHAAPRSKANILRNVATGALDPSVLASPEMRELNSQCFNCKQCQFECPSKVNIPQLMIEARAAWVAANGLNRADWILSRAHSFGPLGGAVSFAANRLIASPVARFLLEKSVGISRYRKLPLFARRSFLQTAPREVRRLPVGGSSPGVVYFVGDYANYYDPQLAESLVRILQHNRVPVHVPAGQLASGMAMVSAGDLAAARELAEHNVRELVEFAREGCDIICTEPSAAVCLSQEYPMLLNHPDAELVASRVVEAGDYLLRRHVKGELRTDFDPLPLRVDYHTPCHLRALGRGRPLHELLSLIPELELHTIEQGCSGMAGAFGLTRENFRTSLRIGWGLITHMRASEVTLGATECSSCKFQMEQGTPTPTLHPLKLLALAYGLMPEIRERLRPSRSRMTVT